MVSLKSSNSAMMLYVVDIFYRCVCIRCLLKRAVTVVVFVVGMSASARGKRKMSVLGAGVEGVYALTVEARFPIQMRRHLLRSIGRRADGVAGDGTGTWGSSLIIADSIGGS